MYALFLQWQQEYPQHKNTIENQTKATEEMRRVLGIIQGDYEKLLSQIKIGKALPQKCRFEKKNKNRHIL